MIDVVTAALALLQTAYDAQGAGAGGEGEGADEECKAADASHGGARMASLFLS